MRMDRNNPTQQMTLQGRWNTNRIFDSVTGTFQCPTRDRCVRWCMSAALLPYARKCTCGKMMSLVPSTKSGTADWTCIGLRFRCYGPKRGGIRRHDVSHTIAENTWFSFHRQPIERILFMTYGMARSWSYDTFRNEMSIDDQSISSETVADYYSYIREVMMVSLDERFAAKGRIGGEGRVAEIDEMKFGKRKYNVGRLKDGHWILVIVLHKQNDDDIDEVRLEICPNNNRSAASLVPLIEKHVLPGTVVMTDLWRGYNSIDQRGYYRLTVNHSANFVDPLTWANTQKVEAINGVLRRALRRGNAKPDNIADHMCEFLWRRECRIKNLDPFAEIIKDISRLYPGVGLISTHNEHLSTVSISDNEMNVEDDYDDDVFDSNE